MKERIQQFTRFLEAAGGRKPADLLLTNLMPSASAAEELLPLTRTRRRARKKSWTAADSSRSPALWTLMCI